jgi:hypothetical protein
LDALPINTKEELPEIERQILGDFITMYPPYTQELRDPVYMKKFLTKLKEISDELECDFVFLLRIILAESYHVVSS